MDTSGLVKLDLAADRLGGHVETLRIRVRDGRLQAVRGPHGAYYVSEPALAALPPLGRRVSSDGAPTAAERKGKQHFYCGDEFRGWYRRVAAERRNAAFALKRHSL